MASLFRYLFGPLLLLQLFFSLTSPRQSYKNISLGSSLSSLDETPYWTSPSGEFAFGFYPQHDRFLLAIWFAKISLKTIVWTAYEGYSVDGGATIQLTSIGVLSLRTPNGTEIWNAQANDNSEVAYAAMLDTGNFVLTSTELAAAWESFDNPTDTILPTQTLQLGSRLLSRLTESNYTEGRFLLSLQSDGNFVFNSINLPTGDTNDAYWASDTVSNGSQLVFNQSGYIYLSLKNRSIYNLPPTQRPISTKDYYQRATLDYDGVFRQYTYPRTATREPRSWSQLWSLPEDICAVNFGKIGSGVCGFNSYCRLNENQRPECLCPPGYTYSDLNNTFGGCRQNFVPQPCGTNITDGFRMQELPDTDWPFDDYLKFQFVSTDWCSERCLSDCLCAVAIVGESSCWLKKVPLSRGRINSSLARTALVKVGLPITATTSEQHKIGISTGRKVIIGATTGVGGLLLILLLIYIRYSSLSRFLAISHWRNKVKNPTNMEAFLERYGCLALQRYRYSDIKKMTNSFKETLGQGGYGSVFKGKLSDGRLVAVKVLNESKGNGEDFMNEVAAIGRTNHVNIVSLLGFCIDGGESALVYEFMPNGSLEKFIYNEKNPSSTRPRLGWEKLYQIGLGIAKGLEYLHQGCNTRILHFDIKPHNILLDQDFCPKISDFGLAKLCPTRESIVSMLVARGTIGYIAPEVYCRNFGGVSHKSDVYSYGMMVLEMIGGRKNIVVTVENTSEIYFPQWVYNRLEKDIQVEGSGEIFEHEISRKMIMVALWCVQIQPADRPSISKVVEMLEGNIEELQMPPNPFQAPPSE